MTRARQTADERLAACLSDAQMAAERAAFRVAQYRRNLAEARASFVDVITILENARSEADDQISARIVRAK